MNKRRKLNPNNDSEKKWAFSQINKILREKLPFDIINILCEYDNELLYKIFLIKNNIINVEVEGLRNSIKPVIDKIDNLNNQAHYLSSLAKKKFCPHNETVHEREWDGHRGHSYYYCKLCNSSV